MKICIVSADDKFIKELSASAKSNNIDVCGSTSSGTLALLLVKQSAPDVIILDAVLCDIDGLQVLEKIKEQQLKTKSIIVSGISNPNIVQKAINLGCSYYIIKPTTYEKIIERVRDVYEVLPLSNPMPEFAGQPPVAVVEKPEKNKVNIEERLSTIFISIGLPPHIRGYQYLREAICLTVKNPSLINQITKKLYPLVAEKFETSPSKVERSIRHSIDVAWTRGRFDNLNKLFGVKVCQESMKPTNGEFIALIADKLLLEGA